MVYLAELLVVMTYRLKIVRIMLKMCTAYTDTSAEMTTHLASLSRSRKVTVLCSRCAGALSW